MRERLLALEQRLKNMEAMRQELARLEQALQVLTPEERLVVDRLVVHPVKGNAQVLCELLALEQSSVYRRKDRALRKLDRELGGEN